MSPTIAALPTDYKLVEEWARIWVAYTLHYVFISSPTAKELLNLVKSFHDLTPYAALKLGLSLVNPTIAIRTIVSIVLGQPGGQASLFQRIFSIILNSGIRSLTKQIIVLEKRIDNASISDAVKKYVASSPDRREAMDIEARTFDNTFQIKAWNVP